MPRVVGGVLPPSMILLSTLIAMSPSASASQSRISLEEVSRTDSYSLGRPTSVRPLTGAETVLFLRSGPDDRSMDLWAVDLKTKKERRLLSAAEVLDGGTEKLSAAEAARRERQRIRTSGFTSFSLSKDERRVLLKLSGKVFLFDRKSEAWGPLELGTGEVLDPRLSPSGDAIAFVRDHNLHVAKLSDVKGPGEPVPCTIEPRTIDGSPDRPRGLAEFVAQEEMARMHGYWWSPDGTRLAVQLSDATAVERMHVADAAHPEQEPIRFAYPRPGQTNVHVRLAGVEAHGPPNLRPINWDTEAFEYLARVVWRSDSELGLLVQSRDQHRQQWITSRLDGASSTMLTETNDAWINLANGAPKWIHGGQTLLWASEAPGGESTGWKLEAMEGDVRRTVVAPSHGLFAVAHVDEARGWVWFVGGPNPTQQHLYRAPLDGSAPPVAVTQGVGHHAATFAPDGATVAIATTTLEQLPMTAVHSIEEDGSLGSATAIPSRAAAPTILPKVELVDPERAGGLNALIIRPSDYEEGRAYPVVLYVYGGPHVNVVQAMAQRFFVQQYIADHGFAVVSIDGRGTPRRGHDFERAIDQDFADVPLEDQIRGLKALGESYPELDVSRVGVYGWSFGGYMSALSVLRRPDVFLAGVAGAPVTEWRYYDTHYTERYLGVPDGKSTEADAAYDEASLLKYADNLQRPLMLVHGIADDNVYFAHSLQLADALFRAGKTFELIPLVGLTHQLSDATVRQKLFDHIVRFFEAHLGAPCRIGS